MPNVNDVINGLEVCSPTGCAKEKCPYYEGPESEFWGNPDGYECEFNLRQDAIALLKAQEPLEPVIVNGEPECAECRYELRSDADSYCPCCGRKVKWE